MINSQKISAGQNSQVIQSAGDTNVGITPEQMSTVISAISDQLPKFAAMATEIFDARFESFKEKILSKFLTHENANAQAFTDPDFLYAVRSAQIAYSRCGDEETADNLVELIAQRSKQVQRGRLSLCINEAIEKSTTLTKNEFAALSLIFLLRDTKYTHVNSISSLADYLRGFLNKILDDVSAEDSSYHYLVSQNCAYWQFHHTSLVGLLQGKYSGAISIGATLEDFEKVLGADFQDTYPNLVINSINEPQNYQANATSLEDLKSRLQAKPEIVESVWSVHMRGHLTEIQLIERLQQNFPDIEKLLKVWNDTRINFLQLTSVGTAIGFANLKRVSGFDSNLRHWIR
jgi:hypothetical protein